MNTKQLMLMSFCSSIIIISKLALSFIPNVELVTFLLIIYTLIFGFKRAFAISIVYSIAEMLIWGFGVQLYIWLLIVIVTAVFKDIFKENFILWSLYSGFFGLIFGLLCSLPKLLIDYTAFIGYFLPGLIFDAVHMISNYLLMLLLGKVVYNSLRRIISNMEVIDENIY